MDDDLGADLETGDAVAERPDDAGGVAAPDVEILGLSRPLALGDDVDRDAARRPDVVEVDARGHHGDQHLTRPWSGGVDLLDLEGIPRVAKAILADHLCNHARRNLTDRGKSAERSGLRSFHRYLQLPGPPCPAPTRVFHFDECA